MQAKNMVWLMAKCWATRATLEVAQVAFLEAGSIGIEIDDGIGPEGQKKYPDDRILLKAYFEPGAGQVEEIEKCYQKFFSACGFLHEPIEFLEIEKQDWQQNFVRSCTAFRVEPNIHIVPSFEIATFKKADEGDIVIEMDPENAFGTGQHETTKLCLTAIHRILAEKRGAICLDVGTGSGILAILMKKLSASSVVASETDGDALATAQRNAKKNGVMFDALLVAEDHVYERERFDLVVANILAPVLIGMASDLLRAVKRGGYLILSGILHDQADEVINAYGELGAKLLRRDQMNDWCALIFLK